jgi:hypothetical protein
MQMLPWEPVILGIALAATAGLRLFMPFLFIGGMVRYANMPAPGMLEWTASDAGFLLLLIAAVLEVMGDKIPAVDHALDMVATFVKPVAGLILPLALLQDASPLAAWTLGIAAGAPLALGVHATKAGTRAVSSATTLGIANPIVSIFEDALALLIMLFTVLAPLIAALIVLLLGVFVVRSWRRLRRRLQTRGSPSAPG